ncbi:transposase [Bradyrhizobium sp. USDA 4503]
MDTRLEHARLNWTRCANSHTGRRHVTAAANGRTHVSTRPRSVLFGRFFLHQRGRPHMSITTISPDLISRVTDAVVEEAREWQSRPRDAVYPIVFFDALRVRYATTGLVKNKARLRRAGIQCRWREGRPGDVDRADRGC